MRCSKPVLSDEGEYCLDCTNKRFRYISGRAVWSYDKMVAQSLARFKFKDKQEYSYFYASEMIRLYGNWIKKQEIEALVPVPIHIAKRRMRGYNQAELLAGLIGENLNLPVLSKALIRTRNTRPQKQLTNRERKVNLEQAFSGDYLHTEGVKKVVLIDDIYTTGSTIEACTKVLSELDIKEVYFLCVSIGAFA